MSAMPQGGAPTAEPADAPGQGAHIYDLHKCGADAHKALEKFATELAKSDAPKDVLSAVGSMADDISKMTQAYAKLGMKAASPAHEQQPASMADATNAFAADVRQP